MSDDCKLTYFMMVFPFLLALMIVVGFIDESVFLYSLLLIFIVAGIVLISGRGAWFVAGYNSLDPLEKKRYSSDDVKTICRAIGIADAFVVVMILVAIVDDDRLTLISLLLFFVVVFLTVAYIIRYLPKRGPRISNLPSQNLQD